MFYNVDFTIHKEEGKNDIQGLHRGQGGGCVEVNVLVNYCFIT